MIMKSTSYRYKSALIEQLLHHLNSEDGNVSIDLPLVIDF